MAIPIVDIVHFKLLAYLIINQIGDGEENTVIPTKEAIELLKAENKNSEIHLFNNCDHCFVDYESKLANLIVDFLITFRTIA